MGDKGQHDTGIEWTHVPGYKGATWNPVRGCVKISPGCKNCYAETFAERWRGVAGHPYEQGFDLRLVPEKLDEPLRKQKPHAYFVNSMSDLHQDVVPDDFVRMVYAVMHATARHLYMVLTKRPENMLAAVLGMLDGAKPTAIPSRQAGRPRDAIIGAPLRNGPTQNVWLGVSVEDRKYGLSRVDVLRTIPATVRFLSVEPLLEDLGDVDLTGIHWVIVGGESGRKARPFGFEWCRRVVDQCHEQNVPVFVKQPGDNPQVIGGLIGKIRVRDKGDRAALAAYGLDVREWPRCVAEKAVPPCA